MERYIAIATFSLLALCWNSKAYGDDSPTYFFGEVGVGIVQDGEPNPLPVGPAAGFHLGVGGTWGRNTTRIYAVLGLDFARQAGERAYGARGLVRRRRASTGLQAGLRLLQPLSFIHEHLRAQVQGTIGAQFIDLLVEQKGAVRGIEDLDTDLMLNFDGGIQYRFMREWGVSATYGYRVLFDGEEPDVEGITIAGRAGSPTRAEQRITVWLVLFF